MTYILDVDGIAFNFDDGVAASKYDDWTFYRRHFCKITAGIKSVDLLVCSVEDLYLVEVKDYRHHPRTKPSEISAEIALKVFHTLAAIIPAQCNANVSAEQELAIRAARATRIRVVLHIEQNSTRSRLQPRIFDLASIQQKLRSTLRAIDKRVVVSDRTHMHDLPWLIG